MEGGREGDKGKENIYESNTKMEKYGDRKKEGGLGKTIDMPSDVHLLAEKLNSSST